jgi:CRISPR-associated protein Csm5
MATTTYTLTCLSPVHVGTGTQFGKFDGVYHNGQWHYIELDKVLARGVNANELARTMNNREFSWATWLRDKSIAPSDVATYILPCPQDPEEILIRETIKNVHEQPYLPGSSIKGAIRTAVVWRLMNGHTPHRTFAAQYLTLCLCARDLFTEIQRRRAFDTPDTHRIVLVQMIGISDAEARVLQQTLYRILNVREDRLREQREWRNFQQRLERLGRNREWLGQPVERAIFGRDPNHDLMRALQIRDTEPVGLEHLAVGLAWTYTLRGNRLVEKREQDGEYKIFVEWLVPGTTLQLSFRIDDLLFNDEAERELHFRGAKEEAVREVAHTCNAYTRTIIASQKAFYEKYGLGTLRDFYSDLETTLNGLSKEAFLLNIGWGSGWEIKTVGDLLRAQLGSDSFKQLRQRYRLGENPKTHQLDPNGLFPHTRRVAYERGAPMWPMGWILLEPM